jgi:hypothetical protein
MSTGRRIHRTLQVVAAVGVALFTGRSVVRAEETPAPVSENRACTSAFKSAQQRVQSGRFVEASSFFAKCAREVCGDSLAQECSQRNNDLYSDLSSVVFLVTDRTGEPMTEVQVSMDGAPLTSRLDGLSLPVEAGPHEFSFSTSTGIFASQKIVIFRGQRNRPISVVRPAEQKSTSRTSRSTSQG